MLWLVLLVIFGVFIYVKVLKRQQYFKIKKVPHEKPWPIMGNMVSELFFHTSSFAEATLKQSMENKEHRYYGFYQLWVPVLMIHDFDLIKRITIKDFDSFTDHLSFASEKFDPLFTNSLLLAKGQKWKHLRSTLSPAFTSSKMRSMFHLMSDCAEQFTEYFLENAEPGKHTTVEMKDIFTRYANDVIATCAFGVKCDSLIEKENEFYVMGKRATDHGGPKMLKMFLYTINQRIMEFFNVRLIDLDVQDFFRSLVKTTMNTREEKGIIRPDLIHLLMQAQKGNLKFEETAKKGEDAGFATVEESQIGREERNKKMELTDEDATAQALAFFFAGFDSSSTLLSHMANELAVNPDIQEKLQAEVDETLLNCKGKITYDAITKMKYMDMVVTETLRKWPPGNLITRVCTKPYTIEAVKKNEHTFTIEKGDYVWIPVYALQRDPEYFPNPERFDPERFSDKNKDLVQSMSFIPFGTGPRNCIGSRFALLETKTLFVHLLSKFDIVVDEKTQIPLKLSKTNFNMTAENGFWLGLKPRNKNNS